VTLTPGSKRGPYEILGQIGAGGMGEIFPSSATSIASSGTAWSVPLDRATFFRDARTGAETRKNVEQLLGLGARNPAAK
jgi:hypothetical protein